MRILVVQESDWLEKGPHQSHHLMERMSARGHEVRVVDFEILWRNHEPKGLLSKRRVFNGVRKATENGSVTVIRPAIVLLPVLDYLSLVCTHWREVKRQIDEYKPDVIVGFGILNAMIALRLSKKRGIPFCYYVIDELHRLVPQKLFRGIARTVERLNMENSTLIVSINEGLRDYTIGMGAERSRTVVIGAGVDLSKYTPSNNRLAVRNRYGIGDRDVVLFFMGWLYEFSGILEVSLDLTANRSHYPNFRLLVMGKGELSERLRQLSNRNHSQQEIILADWQPYDHIPGYLAASDICLLPALDNPIMENIVPIKMYEYMAAGKPTIATSLPGIVREFGEGNGVYYVISPHDVLRKARELIDNNEVVDAGKKARKFVEKFDWSRMTETFESVLISAIHAR